MCQNSSKLKEKCMDPFKIVPNIQIFLGLHSVNIINKNKEQKIIIRKSYFICSLKG